MVPDVTSTNKSRSHKNYGAGNWLSYTVTSQPFWTHPSPHIHITLSHEHLPTPGSLWLRTHYEWEDWVRAMRAPWGKNRLWVMTVNVRNAFVM